MRRMIAIAVSMVLVAAACGGGDDPLTVEEYFAELQRLSTEFDEAASDEIDFESLDAIKSGFREGRDASRDFVSELKSISPPDDLSDLHRDTVSDGEALNDALGDFIDDVLGADSLDDLESIFGDTDEVDQLSDAFTDRCFQLEAEAESRGITVDLACD